MTLRVATVVALGLTVGLGAVSTLLFVAAFQFRPAWFADPAQVVNGGSTSALLFRWAALTDLFSYYLPTAVVAIALWVTLRRRSLVLASAGTAAALGYVLAGGAGAAVLATAGTSLIEQNARPGANHASIAAAFGVLVEVVFRGIWQLLDTLLVAAWLLATAVLVRPDLPSFGRLSMLVGALFLVVTALNIMGLGLARDLALGITFPILTAWGVWLAVLVWRRTPPFNALEA